MRWARDFLAMARHAVLQLRAIDSTVDAMRDALMLQAQRYSDAPHGSADLDPQAAIDAYIDAQAKAEVERVPLQEVVDDALEVLYGPHMRAGVARMLGATYADVLNQRWLQLRTWAAIAADMGVTTRWAQECGRVALEWMDETGESHIRAFNAGEEEFYESMRMEGR